MSRRFRITLQFSALATVCTMSAFAFFWARLGPPPLDSKAKETLPVENEAIETPPLFLSAAAPIGRYGDPEEGARHEEERRQIGIELSRRKENGPIRCSLRARPGAAAHGEAALEVDLRNASDAPVTIGIHRFLLDTVTFILRDPENDVVSSFCYITVHSSARSLPPVTLISGAVDTSPILLSVAAEHGFRALQPGMYSLEAVFHENSFLNPLGPAEGMLARSKRIPIRVE
jgi:hypothetical protein